MLDVKGKGSILAWGLPRAEDDCGRPRPQVTNAVAEIADAEQDLKDDLAMRRNKRSKIISKEGFQEMRWAVTARCRQAAKRGIDSAPCLDCRR